MEHVDLPELLTDPSDIKHLLAAYGDEVPDQPRRSRGRALDVVQTLVLCELTSR